MMRNQKGGMETNYEKIVKENLRRLYSDLPTDLEKTLSGIRERDAFLFQAFGRECRIRKNGVLLAGNPQTGIIGILITLYALNAKATPCQLEPLKSYKDFPNSMPYTGAFTTHTEHILVPKVHELKAEKDKILRHLNGRDAAAIAGGDFSFLVYPLPKVALCYVFYEADEDFPASATCLFSSNADHFLPMDALADVGEYTSKTILQIIGSLTI
jgi:hypothetical protein